MAALRLPGTLLDAHLPKVGPPPISAIETDGEALIFRGAFQIDGTAYDVYVHRWNANGELIKLENQTPVLKHITQEIQRLSKEIFERLDDPTQAKYFYLDPPQKCVEKNLRSGEELLLREESPTFQKMAQIHKLLFNEGGGVQGDNEVSYAKKVPKESAEKRVRFAQEPDPLSGINDQQIIEDSVKEIEDESPGFLKDIEYRELSAYSLKKDKKASDRLYRAYQAFRDVVQNKREDGDGKEMFAWLQKLYQASYRRYQSLEEYYSKRQKAVWEQEGGTFESWCKHFAASSVAGFICVENQEISSLVNALVSTPIK